MAKKKRNMWTPKNLNFIKNLYQKKVIINLYDGQVHKGRLIAISDKSRDDHYSIKIKKKNQNGINVIVSNLIESFIFDNTEETLSKFVYSFPAISRLTNFDIAIYEIGSFLKNDFIYL